MSSPSLVPNKPNRAERMAWDALLCKSRLQPKTRNHSNDRSAFEVDYDRIIFSKPFRRLARKTQVHPLATNDHTHNRLTHSLEVASVGRSLGRAAYDVADQAEHTFIPASAEEFAQLVQAACLAHDVGNTPFGHAGERAIRQWMSEHQEKLHGFTSPQRNDFLLYEGNAQAFRLATRTMSDKHERQNAEEGGIALTKATLATMMKYPWQSDCTYAQAEGKYSVFNSDLSAFNEVVNTTGLLRFDQTYCRHPLAFLVEAADDICNSVIDIEDAIELGIINTNDVHQHLVNLSRLDQCCSIAQMRASAIGNMIKDCLRVFSQNYHGIMRGEHFTPLVADMTTHLSDSFKELNRFAQQNIYPFRTNERMEKDCYETMARILNAITEPNDTVQRLEVDNVTAPFIDYCKFIRENNATDYEQMMRKMDFVSGMTDNYAINLAVRLNYLD